jgi:hypothetical protein
MEEATYALDMQDVYRITYRNQRIYLKLQVANDWAVVISFKAE